MSLARRRHVLSVLGFLALCMPAKMPFLVCGECLALLALASGFDFLVPVFHFHLALHSLMEPQRKSQVLECKQHNSEATTLPLCASAV
eukprot:jgi/Antlo1/1358/1890